MHKLLTPKHFLGLALASLLTASPAFASDGPNDSSFHTDFRQRVELTPTPSAPAAAAAKAILRIREGILETRSSITVEVEDVTPGTYSVSVQKISDSSTVLLGSFDYPGVSSDPDDDATEVKFGGPESLRPLPVGLDVADVAAVLISDAGSNTLFSGDFTNLLASDQVRLKARQRLIAGAGAPGAVGRLEVRARVSGGEEEGRWDLKARNLPGNTPLILSVNGIDCGIFATRGDGRLRIDFDTDDSDWPLPVSLSLFGVETITLRTVGGVEVMSASL